MGVGDLALARALYEGMHAARDARARHFAFMLLQRAAGQPPSLYRWAWRSLGLRVLWARAGVLNHRIVTLSRPSP